MRQMRGDMKDLPLPEVKFLVKQSRAELDRIEDGFVWYFIPYTVDITDECWPNGAPTGATCGIWSGFEFRIPLEELAGGLFEKEMKPLILMRWIRREHELRTKNKQLQDLSTQCMGCQSGWPFTSDDQKSHVVVGGYDKLQFPDGSVRPFQETVSCTKDRH